jgi:hypothetical protein
MAKKSKRIIRNSSLKRSKLNNRQLGKNTKQRKHYKKRTMRGGMFERIKSPSFNPAPRKLLRFKKNEKQKINFTEFLENHFDTQNEATFGSFSFDTSNLPMRTSSNNYYYEIFDILNNYNKKLQTKSDSDSEDTKYVTPENIVFLNTDTSNYDIIRRNDLHIQPNSIKILEFHEKTSEEASEETGDGTAREASNGDTRSLDPPPPRYPYKSLFQCEDDTFLQVYFIIEKKKKVVGQHNTEWVFAKNHYLIYNSKTRKFQVFPDKEKAIKEIKKQIMLKNREKQLKTIKASLRAKFVECKHQNGNNYSCEENEYKLNNMLDPQKVLVRDAITQEITKESLMGRLTKRFRSRTPGTEPNLDPAPDGAMSYEPEAFNGFDPAASSEDNGPPGFDPI